MDQELEIKKLFNEIEAIDDVIAKLKELMLLDATRDCLDEIALVVTKLLDKKAQLKNSINKLADEVVEAAEACAGLGNNWTFEDIF